MNHRKNGKPERFLPDGYSPLDYLEAKAPNYFLLKGFSDEASASARVEILKSRYPFGDYKVLAEIENHRKINGYAVRLPEWAIGGLSSEEITNLFIEPRLFVVQDVVPSIYRFMDKKYVDRFFENGELRLSTYRRTRQLEDANRRDEGEGNNWLFGGDGRRRLEAKTEVGSNAYLLCSSLSRNHVKPDGTAYNSCLFIEDPTRFFEIITDKLMQEEPSLSAALRGPCVYNDKNIVKKIEESMMANLFNLPDEQVVSSLMYMTNFVGGNQAYFTKDMENAWEAEYRMLWLLDKNIDEEHRTIFVPEARDICSSISF